MENGNCDDIVRLLRSHTRLKEDVTHFITYEKGYYAILRGGRRLDIIRTHSFQPPIADFDDYFGYLFVQTHDGFFVLRQRILENRAGPWEAILELEPVETPDFFSRAGQLIEQIIMLAESD